MNQKIKLQRKIKSELAFIVLMFCFACCPDFTCL